MENRITFVFILLFISNTLFSQQEAIYNISFTSSWNATDHSDNGNIPLPSNPHWSKLVGATHNSSVSFFQVGTMASKGVEDVAEIGVNTEFNNEVNTAIGNSFADQWLQKAFNPVGAIGTADLGEITINADYPLLSLISMIAPSPDWFVGIDSFSLLDEGNEWIPTTTIDLFIYDAGTEDGSTYSTSNSASNPIVNISSLKNIAPFNSEKIGTLTITFITTLSTKDEMFSNAIELFPNPAKEYFKVINTSDLEIVSIKLYDVMGKLVKTQFETGTFETSSLQKGIYFVKVLSVNDKTFVKKVIIN